MNELEYLPASLIEAVEHCHARETSRQLSGANTGGRVPVRMAAGSASASATAACLPLALFVAVPRASHSGAGSAIGAITQVHAADTISVHRHRDPAPPLVRSTLLALATVVLIALCNVSSAQCPDNTWTLYVDGSGVQGNINSCIKLFNTNTASWQASSSGCVALGLGAHLLTSRQVLMSFVWKPCHQSLHPS
jgi:hypothetical protein